MIKTQRRKTKCVKIFKKVWFKTLDRSKHTNITFTCTCISIESDYSIEEKD